MMHFLRRWYTGHFSRMLDEVLWKMILWNLSVLNVLAAIGHSRSKGNVDIFTFTATWVF